MGRAGDELHGAGLLGWPALNGGGSPLTRGVAGGLALIIAVMSLQLFLKHQYFEEMDGIRLRSIERALGIEDVLGYLPHCHGSEERGDVRPMGLRRFRANHRWVVVQLALIVTALFVIVAAWIAPSLLRPQGSAP